MSFLGEENEIFNIREQIAIEIKIKDLRIDIHMVSI